MKDTKSKHVQWELVGGGKEKNHFVPFQLFVGLAYHGKDMQNVNTFNQTLYDAYFSCLLAHVTMLTTSLDQGIERNAFSFLFQ
jgi:hypothetical protein